VEVTRIARKCIIGQETTVHSRVNEGIKSDVRDRDKIIYSVPPTNGWANGTNEPRVRTILEVLCGAQAEGLARVASVGRVCGE